MEKKIDERLRECLNRNSPTGEKLGDTLADIITRVHQQNEIIVPVLGTQGMGKSTLINGLLRADILPNDADETTCVPVEVSYSEKEYAEVLFLDNKPKIIVHTKEELNRYVDNNENPANSKRVECIHLFRNAEILKSGVTIVDLPGVGSVTLENEKTTRKYIENLCAAIFVIPTVPTLRGSEALFIQGAWTQFANAIFVQNNFGDSPRETKDSVEYNTKRLEQISDKIGSHFDGPIIVVNAYEAIAGAIKKDISLIDKSGINALVDKINNLAKNWNANLENGTRERFVGIIQRALKFIALRLDELSKDAENVKLERQRVYSEFKEKNEQLFTRIDKLSMSLSDYSIQSNRKVRELVTKTAGDIRAEIWKVIDGGVFDGERLKDAFNDVQSQKSQIFFDEATNYLNQISIDIQSQAHELQDLMEVQNNLEFEHVEHSTKDKLKWENGLQKAFNIGGAIGGVVGAKAGATAVAAFLGLNPAGWLIAGVGVAITFIAVSFGIGIKKAMQAKRANNAKESLRPIIDQVENKLYQTVRNKNNEYFTNLQRELENIKETYRQKERTLRREARDSIVAADASQLTADKEYLNKIIDINSIL